MLDRASAPLFAVPLLVLLACQTADSPPREHTGSADTSTAEDRRAEAQRLMELEREWSSRFQRGDLDWIVNHHATGARVLPPGSESFVGQEEVRQFWTGLYETEGLSLTFGPDEAHVSRSGDMAYVLGSYAETRPDGSDDRGKYLVVWVKEDGEWRIAADIFNSSVPPSSDQVAPERIAEPHT